MDKVNECYAFTPGQYTSGKGTSMETLNPAGTNSGSLKTYYFAHIHGGGRGGERLCVTCVLAYAYWRRGTLHRFESTCACIQFKTNGSIGCSLPFMGLHSAQLDPIK